MAFGYNYAQVVWFMNDLIKKYMVNGGLSSITPQESDGFSLEVINDVSRCCLIFADAGVALFDRSGTVYLPAAKVDSSAGNLYWRIAQQRLVRTHH